MYWSIGGGLCKSGSYSGVGKGFRGGGGRGSGTGGGVFCEAGSVVCEQEGIFFVSL